MTAAAGVRKEDPQRPPLCFSSKILCGSVGLVELDHVQDPVCRVGRALSNIPGHL